MRIYPTPHTLTVNLTVSLTGTMWQLERVVLDLAALGHERNAILAHARFYYDMTHTVLNRGPLRRPAAHKSQPNPTLVGEIT